MKATSLELVGPLACVLALSSLGACKSEASSSAAGSSSAAVKSGSETKTTADGKTTANDPIRIEVNASGYQPSEVSAKGGAVTQLVFRRTTDKGCGDQLVFPALGIKKDLPVGQDVPVEVTMPQSGSLAFTCGMDMYKGALVVK